MAVASSGAVRAGGAFVELFAKDGALHGALNRAKRVIQSFGAFVGRAGSLAATAGGALLAPLTALLKGGVSYAAELDDLADSFGTTTERVSGLAGAFKVAGLSVEDLGKALGTASSMAQDGESVEDALTRIIHTLDEIPDAAKRAAAFEEVFGAKAARKLSSIAPDLDRLKAGAPIISTEQAKAAEKAQQEFAAALLKVQVALLPVIVMLVPFISRVSELIQQNAHLLPLLFKGAALLFGLGIALKIVAPACALVAGGVGLIGTALTVAIGALGLILSPLGLLIVGFGALVFSTKAAAQAFDGSLGEMGASLRSIGETAKETFGGISDAINAGEWELAFQIALQGMEVAFLKFCKMVEEQWNRTKNAFKGGVDEIRTDVAKKLVDNAEFLTIGGLINRIRGGGKNEKVKNELDKMHKEKLDELNRQAKNAADAAWDGDINKAQQALDKLRNKAKAMSVGVDVGKFAAALAGGMGGMSANDIERMRINEEARRRHPELGRERLHMPQILATLADAAKGMFDSPNFAQSLGLADSINQKLLDEAKEQKQVQIDIKEILKKAGPLVVQ